MVVPGIVPSPGLYRLGVAPAAVSVALTDSGESVTNSAEYVFADRSIGAPDDGRDVIVAGHLAGSSVAPILSSVTIGGVTATVDVQIASGRLRSFIARARVPSGTTAAVVVNASSTAENASVAVYRMTGNAGAPFAIETATGHASSASISCPADGVILGASAVYRTGGVGTNFWTNLTKNYDGLGLDSGTYDSTAASDVFELEQTNRPITNTHAAVPNNQSMVLASYGP